MPYGFDVESGSNLTERLREIVGSFVAGMKKRTLENPVTAEEIVQGYASLGKKIQGSDVRALVNYCRSERMPVGSTAAGYFWARNRSELESTIHHLQDRESAIRRARIGLEHSFEPIQEDIFK